MSKTKINRSELWVFTIVLLVVLSLSSVLGLETTIEDDVLGTASISIKDREFFGSIFSLTQQTILPDKPQIQLGEQISIKTAIEITECISQDQIDTVRMVFTAPSGKTTTKYLSASSLTCASNPEITVKFTPTEKGKWTVFYLVRKKIYPYIVGKEITYFEVVDGVPQCQSQNVGPWTPSSPVVNGQLYQRQTFSYDPVTCTSNLLKTEVKTVCRENYVIEGTSDNTGIGIKKCVLKAQEEPIIIPPPAQEVSTWQAQDNVCVLKNNAEGYVSKEECDTSLMQEVPTLVYTIISIGTDDVPRSVVSYQCQQIDSVKAGNSLVYATLEECQSAIKQFSNDENTPIDDNLKGNQQSEFSKFIEQNKILIAILVIIMLAYIILKRRQKIKV